MMAHSYILPDMTLDDAIKVGLAINGWTKKKLSEMSGVSYSWLRRQAVKNRASKSIDVNKVVHIEAAFNCSLIQKVPGDPNSWQYISTPFAPDSIAARYRPEGHRHVVLKDFDGSVISKYVPFSEIPNIESGLMKLANDESLWNVLRITDDEAEWLLSIEFPVGSVTTNSTYIKLLDAYRTIIPPKSKS